jgi:exosortase A
MAVTGRDIQSDAKPMGADPWPVAWSALLASVFGVTLIFSDTIAGMIQIWSNSDAFGHGFLIAPISAFLLWYGRDRLADISPRPCFWGLGAMIVALIAWLLGRLAGFLILENFAFVAVIQSLFLILLGWRAMRILAFPLFYLIVMVPFGEFLIPFLQDLTAILVVQALRIVDVPVFLDGVMLTIPTGAFEVAETCSGLRFMIAVVALGLIFAHLAYDDWLRKGIFMAIAICTTIVGNVLRAFGLVYLAHMTNLEVTDWADHITYGWVFLSFLLIILFWLGLKLRKNDVEKITTTSRPSQDTGNLDPTPKAWFIVTALCLILVVAATSAYAARQSPRPAAPLNVALSTPIPTAPWIQKAEANKRMPRC